MAKEISNIKFLGISDKKLQEIANQSGMTIDELSSMIEDVDVQIEETPNLPDLKDALSKKTLKAKTNLNQESNDFIAQKMKKYKKNR